MINADDLLQWYKAQELVYASATQPDNYSIRLTVVKFSDFPVYRVTRRHIIRTLNAPSELYCGTSIDAAVRIYNEATNSV
jgi:hypothetical protein